MGERLRIGFIALTAVVVALAIASAIFSAARPAPSQGEVRYTPSATPSPSPSPRLTFTLQPPTSTPVATDTPSPSPTFMSYVFKPGETLSGIASRFGVTLQALLAANPDITDPRRIQNGQRIFVPPPGWAPNSSPSSS
jgi:LysM repeat protein